MFCRELSALDGGTDAQPLLDHWRNLCSTWVLVGFIALKDVFQVEAVAHSRLETLSRGQSIVQSALSM